MTTAEVPGVYQRFATAIGAGQWQGAVARQEEAIRSNLFLGDYLHSEYAIAYQLDRLRRMVAGFGTVPYETCSDPSFFPSLAFAAQVLGVLDISSHWSAEIRIERFNIASIEATKDKGLAELREAIDAATGTANREAAYWTPAGGMLVFVMQSAVGDAVLDRVFATLHDSAARQFTCKCGALFWVALQGIDADQLLSAHEQDSGTGQQTTALKLGLNDFLNRAPDNIVGVVFSSRSGLIPAVDGDTDSGGTTNFFMKEHSPFWHASFRGPLRAAAMTP